MIIIQKHLEVCGNIVKIYLQYQAGNDGTKNVEIMVSLSYLNVFWRSLELPLIKSEVNLILTWFANCAVVSTNVTNQNAIFAITDTKLYVPAVTLSTQDNAKLLQKLKSGFKRVINRSKYLSKPELLAKNQNLNLLVKPCFQGANRIFALAFENDSQITSAKGCYLPNVKKGCKCYD